MFKKKLLDKLLQDIPYIIKNNTYYFNIKEALKVLTNLREVNKYWTKIQVELLTMGLNIRKNILISEDFKEKTNSYGFINLEGLIYLILIINYPATLPYKVLLTDYIIETIKYFPTPLKALANIINYYLDKGYSPKWFEERTKLLIQAQENDYQENDIYNEEISNMEILYNLMNETPYQNGIIMSIPRARELQSNINHIKY